MSHVRSSGASRRSSSLLRVGDMVMVIAGGNKKKNPLKSQVGKVMAFTGVDRVVVEGLNMRLGVGRSASSGRGELVRKEGSMHLSNVMYYAQELGRPVRLKVRVKGDGTKVRGYVSPANREFVEIAVK